MPNRKEKLYYDILRAGDEIQAFTQNLSLEEYTLDLKSKAAVERKFEIIGEALRRLRDEWPEDFEKIPMGHEIIGMRNRLIHGYDDVDDQIIWETIEIHLPRLLKILPPA